MFVCFLFVRVFGDECSRCIRKYSRISLKNDLGTFSLNEVDLCADYSGIPKSKCVVMFNGLKKAIHDSLNNITAEDKCFLLGKCPNNENTPGNQCHYCENSIKEYKSRKKVNSFITKNKISIDKNIWKSDHTICAAIGSCSNIKPIPLSNEDSNCSMCLSFFTAMFNNKKKPISASFFANLWEGICPQLQIGTETCALTLRNNKEKIFMFMEFLETKMSPSSLCVASKLCPLF